MLSWLEVCNRPAEALASLPSEPPGARGPGPGACLVKKTRVTSSSSRSQIWRPGRAAAGRQRGEGCWKGKEKEATPPPQTTPPCLTGPVTQACLLRPPPTTPAAQESRRTESSEVPSGLTEVPRDSRSQPLVPTTSPHPYPVTLLSRAMGPWQLETESRLLPLPARQAWPTTQGLGEGKPGPGAPWSPVCTGGDRGGHRGREDQGTGQPWAEGGPSEDRDRAGRVAAGGPGRASRTRGLFIFFHRLRLECPLPTSWAHCAGAPRPQAGQLSDTVVLTQSHSGSCGALGSPPSS